YATTYKVAFLSDTHNYYDDVSDLIDRINVSGPYAFVVVTGDITNVGLLSEFEAAQKMFARLKFPVLVAAGNHDMISNGKTIYDRLYGPDKLSFEFKNVQYVMLNNNNWELGGNVPDVDWVEQEVAASSSPFKILMAHIPVNDTERFTESEINRWRNLINSNGVTYFICGHDHNHDVSDFGNAQQIIIGSGAKRSYVELIVTPTGVSHQLIKL
ncbi:MAG: metallophosphoesterase family protein, partial [Bacteriovoracia bacterium]